MHIVIHTDPHGGSFLPENIAQTKTPAIEIAGEMIKSSFENTLQ